MEVCKTQRSRYLYGRYLSIYNT